MLPFIEATTGRNPPQLTVIWLHGLGANGYDFAGIAPELQLPPDLSIHFIFPHAPNRPVTLNQGYVMPAWYDIKSLESLEDEDETGIRQSQNTLEELISHAMQTHNLPSEQILLAGFSQGGAIALQTALRHPTPLAGVIGLSTYLPLSQTLAAEKTEANLNIPIMMAHGTQDPIIPLIMANHSKNFLEELGYSVDWNTYPMAHSVCPQEMLDIGKWLTKILQRFQG